MILLLSLPSKNIHRRYTTCRQFSPLSQLSHHLLMDLFRQGVAEDPDQQGDQGES